MILADDLNDAVTVKYANLSEAILNSCCKFRFQ